MRKSASPIWTSWSRFWHAPVSSLSKRFKVAHYRQKYPLSTIFAALRKGVRTEFWTLAILSLVAATLFAFAELADDVSEGDTHEFDTAVLLALRNPADRADPIGPP